MSHISPEERDAMYERIIQCEIKLDVIITEMRSYNDHITAISILVEELGQKVDEINRQVSPNTDPNVYLP